MTKTLTQPFRFWYASSTSPASYLELRGYHMYWQGCQSSESFYTPSQCSWHRIMFFVILLGRFCLFGWVQCFSWSLVSLDTDIMVWACMFMDTELSLIIFSISSINHSPECVRLKHDIDSLALTRSWCTMHILKERYGESLHQSWSLRTLITSVWCLHHILHRFAPSW